jgi:hypothetical protein
MLSFTGDKQPGEARLGVGVKVEGGLAPAEGGQCMAVTAVVTPAAAPALLKLRPAAR